LEPGHPFASNFQAIYDRLKGVLHEHGLGQTWSTLSVYRRGWIDKFEDFEPYLVITTPDAAPIPCTANTSSPVSLKTSVHGNYTSILTFERLVMSMTCKLILAIFLVEARTKPQDGENGQNSPSFFALHKQL